MSCLSMWKCFKDYLIKSNPKFKKVWIIMLKNMKTHIQFDKTNKITSDNGKVMIQLLTNLLK